MAIAPAADQPGPSEHAGNPVASPVATIGSTLMAMLGTRFELLRADLDEEQESLIAQVRLSVIAGEQLDISERYLGLSISRAECNRPLR